MQSALATQLSQANLASEGHCELDPLTSTWLKDWGRLIRFQKAQVHRDVSHEARRQVHLHLAAYLITQTLSAFSTPPTSSLEYGTVHSANAESCLRNPKSPLQGPRTSRSGMLTVSAQGDEGSLPLRAPRFCGVRFGTPLVLHLQKQATQGVIFALEHLKETERPSRTTA
ncbi:hypothetical protein VTI28DRAFT_1952 [Corynascus sepedonium]